MIKRPNATACLVVVLCVFVGTKTALENTFLPQVKRAHPNVELSQAGYRGKSLKRFAFGFDNLIASLIWIDLLQKADTRPVEKGKLSWEFMQLDAITELDPKFERAYGFGAPFVSTLRRDAVGGKLLLQKWVKRRPDYWRTHYALGLHLFQEFGDYAHAAPLILKAASLRNAPPWLNSLGVRLLSETGAHLHALKTAIQLYSDIREEHARKRIEGRVRSLNFTIQKSTWENALTHYRTRHRKEPSSIADLKIEMRNQARELASVLADNRIPEEIGPILAEVFEFHYAPKTKTIEPDVSPESMNIERIGIFREGEK